MRNEPNYIFGVVDHENNFIGIIKSYGMDYQSATSKLNKIKKSKKWSRKKLKVIKKKK